MHDTLMDHQGALLFRDLIGYARDMGLDTDVFAKDLREHAGAARVAEDVESADLATVSGTPTFFFNGKRYYGAFDLMALKEAVKAAKAQTIISRGGGIPRGVPASPPDPVSQGGSAPL
jgi:protein-disulfide isomerase